MFKKGDIVEIDMMGADTVFVTDESSVGISLKRETRDKGIGIILRCIPWQEVSEDEEDYTECLYQVAVIEGRFDSHRNDMGDLSIWGKELKEISPEERERLSKVGIV